MATQRILALQSRAVGTLLTSVLTVPIDITSFQLDIDVQAMTDPATEIFAFVDLSQDAGTTWQPGPRDHSYFVEHQGTPTPPQFPASKGGGPQPCSLATDLLGVGNTNRRVRGGLEIIGGAVTVAVDLTTPRP